MNKFLLAVLPLALFAAGCNDCKKGSELKAELVRLETQVTGTMAQPSNFGATCLDFQAEWNKKLQKGSRFADYVANNYFYSETRRCVRGHNERRCEYMWDDYGSGRPYRRWHCYNYYVCDQVDVIPHKKDGYDQAKELSQLLAGARGDLMSACAAHERSADAEAYLHLTSAKIKLSASQNDADYVLNRAGCDGRRGD